MEAQRQNFNHLSPRGQNKDSSTCWLDPVFFLSMTTVGSLSYYSDYPLWRAYYVPPLREAFSTECLHLHNTLGGRYHSVCAVELRIVVTLAGEWGLEGA